MFSEWCSLGFGEGVYRTMWPQVSISLSPSVPSPGILTKECQTGGTPTGEKDTLSCLRKLNGGEESPETYARRPEQLPALQIALTIPYSSLGLNVLLGKMAIFKLHDF